MKEIYLIDALNIIFRSYHVMKNSPLINKKGENVNAFLGFFKTLFFIIREKNPEYLIITFDSKAPTLRKQMYPPYKANRDAPPDDLIPQIEWIKEGLSKANIPMFEMDGYEADDLMASFARKAEAENYLVHILSPDKDLLQLMNKKTKIIRLENSGFIELNNDYVLKKFGVNNNQIRDYLSIVGDKSDNIPGIKGIGEKGASNLLKEFKTLELIYKNLDSINKKYKEILTKEKENAFLSYELIQLEESLELPSLDNFKIGTLSEDIIPLFEEHSASSLIKTYRKEILKQKITNTEQKNLFSSNSNSLNSIGLLTIYEEKVNYKAITEKSELNSLIEKLKASKFIAIDTETDSLNTNEANIVGISVSVKEKEAYYIPIKINNTNNTKYIEKEYVVKKFDEFFSTNPKLIGQNYKFDYKILKNNGFKIITPFFDTMIAAYLINSSGKVSLDFLSEKYLGHKNIKYEEIVPKNASFENVPIEIAIDYAAEDADVTFRLFSIFEDKLKEDGLDSLMHDIEMPFNAVLTEMEENGIYLDKKYLKKYGEELDVDLKTLENEIIKHIGVEFNLNSPKQLHEVLFNKLNLTLPSTVKKDSTDIKVLEALKDQNEVIPIIIEYRQISKLKGTYTDNLIELINPNTKRIHTSFIQTRTATGRISSINPNLQNIPIKDEKGRKIREAFKPEEGYIFISADYSQIELVVLAHLSEDEELIRAFSLNKDIHTETAARLFKINEDEVSPELRRIAKSINFGIIYRMSDFRLAKELGLKRDEAKEFIASYFKLYSKIEKFIVHQINFVREHGYSETILKRRRYIKEINSKNYLERSGAERIAINSAIQGSAADIMKIAMIKVLNEFKIRKLKSKLILQVHDEILVESPLDEKDIVKKILKEMMENAYELKLPLKTNIEIGASWGEIH